MLLAFSGYPELGLQGLSLIQRVCGMDRLREKGIRIIGGKFAPQRTGETTKNESEHRGNAM